MLKVAGPVSIRQKTHERARGSSHLIVGGFGLTASYSLLFEDLMSKLMVLLIVGVLRPSACRPLRVRSLMSKLMGFFLGRGGGI